MVTEPYNVYAQAASRRAYSLFLFSFGTTSSSSADGLTSVLATHDPERGMGAFNRTRYSNPAFDAALQRALGLFDAAARNQELAAATAIAMKDTALIPLYWQVVHWGTRNGSFIRAASECGEQSERIRGCRDGRSLAYASS